MFTVKLIIERLILKKFLSVKPHPILDSKVIKEKIEANSNEVNESSKDNLVAVSNNIHLKDASKSSDSVSITNVEKTNNSISIYVYMGTYCREFVKLEDPNQSRKIDFYSKDDFERENIVLYPPKGVPTLEFFYQVRETYFKTLNKYGLEKAIEKILELQSNLLKEPLSLEDLVREIISDDDEEFEVEFPLKKHKI